MTKKLYVGNLSYNTGEDALKTLFAQVGTVESVNIIMDRATGRSKGFAFVEMSTEEEAKKAIDSFNGQENDGRALIVNEARPQEERPRQDGFNRGSGGRRDDNGKRRF